MSEVLKVCKKTVKLFEEVHLYSDMVDVFAKHGKWPQVKRGTKLKHKLNVKAWDEVQKEYPELDVAHTQYHFNSRAGTVEVKE